MALNPDETRVALLARTVTFGRPPEVRERMADALYRRLVDGIEVYGHLDLDADERDFEAEFGDEMCDGENYLAMLEEQARRTGKPVAHIIEARRLVAEAWALLGGKTTG